jgi:hypothetical protein
LLHDSDGLGGLLWTALRKHDRRSGEDVPMSSAKPFLRGLVKSPGMLPRLGAAPLIALAVSLPWDFGREISIDLYSTAAQISVVLALAGFVELVLLATRMFQSFVGKKIGQAEVDSAQTTHDVFLFEVLWYFVATEAAALYAIASEDSTTFLALTMLIGLALQVWSLVALYRGRMDEDLAELIRSRP